ncbi:MAG: hypothetical protein IT385_20380 [Deltaproteobacteria bacterium]|nr:hypothetical protein [Deltaproteobacteria bacterium]
MTRTPLLVAVATSLALAACGKEPAPAPADAAAGATTPPPGEPAPTEPAPFTLSYTFQDRPGAALMVFVLSSDGALTATTDTPPTRYVGKLDAAELENIARLIANPGLRGLPEVNTNGADPIVDLELSNAKSEIWRRRFVGNPPDLAKPLLNRLESWQEAAKREEKPPGLLRLDVTRIEPGATTRDTLTVHGNSLVMVTRDDKAQALGSAAMTDLDRLRVSVSLLEGVRQPVPDPKGPRYEIHLERTDDTTFDLKLEGRVPLALDPLLAHLETLRAATKPVVAFDRFSAEIRTVVDGKKGPVEVLTIDANGALTLTSNGKPAGTGEAAIQDLWGLRSALVGFEKLPAATFPKGAMTTEDIVFKLEGPGAPHTIYTPRYEPAAGAGKLVVVLGRLRKAITPIDGKPE